LSSVSSSHCYPSFPVVSRPITGIRRDSTFGRMSRELSCKAGAHDGNLASPSSRRRGRRRAGAASPATGSRGLRSSVQEWNADSRRGSSRSRQNGAGLVTRYASTALVRRLRAPLGAYAGKRNGEHAGPR
jgi:predicted nucleic acid-binding Zn ribbon protein